MTEAARDRMERKMYPEAYSEANPEENPVTEAVARAKTRAISTIMQGRTYLPSPSETSYEAARGQESLDMFKRYRTGK